MEEKFPFTGKSENKRQNKGFITVDDTIARAKEEGVSFGNGKARNRLRYYAKNGLIPVAERKVFIGNLPTGAYPEYVVDILVNIDAELRKGKTIQAIIKEKKKEAERLEMENKKTEKIKFRDNSIIPVSAYESMLEGREEWETEEKREVEKNDNNLLRLRNNNLLEEEESKDLENPVIAELRKKKIASPYFAKAIIVLSILGLTFFLFSSTSAGKNSFSKFFASMDSVRLLLQEPSQVMNQEQATLPQQGFNIFQDLEPYLTINAETDINAPLNLKEGEGPAKLTFSQGEFQGIITPGTLTDNRSYTLPDQTGTICLSSGNCADLSGEISATGGISNRLARFSSSQKIESSSINDMYQDISIYITQAGNVGIGTSQPTTKLEVVGDILSTNVSADKFFANESIGIGTKDPNYALDVEGRIQASGDICTDKGGGVCLSKVDGASVIMIGGGGGTLDGSGSGNYLAKWSDSDTLANSVLYESSNNIGIGANSPNAKLTVGGVISLAEASEPDVTSDYGKIYVASDGKLYFKDELGSLYDLTSPGVSGSGKNSQIAFFTASSTVAGNSNFLWDNTNGRLGIGTTSPSTLLELYSSTADAKLTITAATSADAQVVFKTGASSTIQALIGIDQSDSNKIKIVRGFDIATSTGITIDSAGNVGIGTSSPSQKLEVSGTIKAVNFIASAFQLTTGATSGYALISDASGIGTWQSLASATLPSGTGGQTLRNDGSSWIANSFFYNNGTAIGIGTTSPSATLTVVGDMSLAGPLSLTTSTLPQLVLAYDANNYLDVSINGDKTALTASKLLVIDSLTGEIKIGSSTSLFNASLATVQAATFASAVTDSTVRKSGEYVLRGSTSIFRYSMAAQSNSTSYIRVSKYFENALNVFPSLLPGAVRKYVFLVNFADDIPPASTSDWRIYRPGAVTEYDSFNSTGQELATLEEGYPQMSDYLDLPSDDWQLEVKVPNGNKMRIFNIMLLAYDKIN